MVSSTRVPSLAGLIVLLSSLSVPAPGVERSATEDTWVYGASAFRDANFSSGEFLKVRARDPRIALIRFDVSSLPAGEVTMATLNVRVSRVVAAGQVQVRQVLQPWQESTVTFNTRPEIASGILSGRNITLGDSGQVVSFDVTAAVAQWLSDPSSNHGLAITASGSPADIYFGTSNVGTAPTLSIEMPNTVTVSRTGGDYSDPVTAVNNAFSGDTWCVNPGSPKRPCVLSIDEGIFILRETLVVPGGIHVIGAEKSATALVADKGLGLAVAARGDPQEPDRLAAALSDLSIVNHQSSQVAEAVGLTSLGPLALSRVAIQAEGADSNIGLITGGEPDIVENCDISAVGGRNARAIDADVNLAIVRITDSRLSATGASESNIGIESAMDVGIDLGVTDTSVVVAGGTRAFGLLLSDEDAGGYMVTGGMVTATSAGRAAAISGGDVSTDLTVIGTQLIASGPDAIGVGWFSVGSIVLVDGVSIHSDGVALSFFEETQGELTVLRSKLIGGTRGLELDAFEPGGGTTVTTRVDDSIIKAPIWLSSVPGGTFTAQDSILDGAAQIPSALSVTCTRVLGSDYRPLASHCTPQ